MIDTSNWKKFRIGDLFKIEPCKGKNQQLLNEGNDVPYIAASKENNGFNRMVSIEGHEDWVSKGNCLQFIHIGDAAAGHVNYIHTDFIGMSGKSSCAYNDNLNEYNGLFIASIIVHTNAGKYSFKDSWTGTKVPDTIIKLPATPDGQPDWDYMESYMKTVIEESEKSLENLRKADDTKHLIDVSEWKEFSCRELFECKNTGNILARDVEDGSGTTPFVTASGYNNGVVGYIDASNYDIIKGHCILVGGKTFTITYQKDDFVSNDSHNFVIRVKGYDISDLSYLYLVTTIYAYFGQKYSWNDAVTKDKLMDDSIPLPSDANGKPDWQYMEDYMKAVMEESKQIVNDLQIGA